ncbi:MAG: hypothetical protein K2P21_06175 [Lachnospiraceae bacterium]|nr:hypothetical protein [Lachnospiraceae bacterium]
MEEIQAISLADVWEIVKSVLAWLAAGGIVIDLTPGIKFQPVRWLLKRMGNLINADMRKQLEELQKEVTEFKVDSWRTEILDFSDSCMNNRRHTKEQFNHVIEILDRYDRYITENGLTNGQVDVAHEYILEIYKRCIRENDFALDEEEERARKEAAKEARNKRF